MRCKRTRSLLTEFIDGALHEDMRMHLEAHFKVCDKCRDEFRGLLSIHEALKTAHRFKAPPGFAVRVMGKLPAGDIRGDAFASASLLSWFRGMGPKSLKLAEAGAIVFAIVTGIVVGDFLSEKILSGRNAATVESGADDVSSLNFLDYLHPAPPESIAGLYLVMKEGGDER